uniref:Proteasome subunit alpha type n=1 Tax=Zeugodacus cucurbitae TaxID=28588 RepID=A0A0A1XPN1_ZEUCU
MIAPDDFTNFSSDGRLLQVEYAALAVNAGAPSLGIVGEDFVVIAADNSHNSLLYDEQGVHKVEPITEHIGMVYSGYKPDYNPILKFARKAAQEYLLNTGEPISVIELVKKIGRLMQEYTQSARLRPFGVSLLICGWYENRPYLFQCNPPGQYLNLASAAVGVDHDKILKNMNKNWLNTEERCCQFSLAQLKAVKGDLTRSNVEIGLCNKRGFRRLPSTEKFLTD